MAQKQQELKEEHKEQYKYDSFLIDQANTDNWESDRYENDKRLKSIVVKNDNLNLVELKRKQEKDLFNVMRHEEMGEVNKVQSKLSSEIEE